MSGKNKSKRDEPAEDTSRGGEHLPLSGNSTQGGWRVDPPGQEGNEHSQRPDLPPGLDPEHHEDDDDVAGLVLTGTDEGEALTGDDGADTLDGAGGDDTLVGGEGADQMTGGAGADVFKLAAEAAEDTDDDDTDDDDTGDDDSDDDDDADDTDGDDTGDDDDADDVDDDSDDDDDDDVDDDEASDDDGLDSILDFTTGEDTLDFGEGLSATEENFATATADDYEAALAAANAAMSDGTVDFVAVQVGDDVIVFADTDAEVGSDLGVLLVGKTLTDVGFGDIG